MAVAVKSAATTVLHHLPTCEGFCPASCLPGVFVIVLHVFGTARIAAAIRGCTVLAWQMAVLCLVYILGQVRTCVCV
jgi:hypothetical protein